MDKFAALKAFVSVVEQGGFAPAARLMRMSRSAVNRMVIELEDSLGVQLLARTTRRVSPTTSGREFYVKAKTILEDLEAAEHELGATENKALGQLRINAPMSFGVAHLGPAVCDFMAQNSDVRIELELNDSFINIIENGYDLTVRIAEPQEDTTLVDFRICEIPRVLVAAPAFLDRHGAPDHPRDLRDIPCLDYGNLEGGRTWRLATEGETVGVRPTSILCSNNGDVLRHAAMEGLGVTMLPLFLVSKDLQVGRLTQVLPDYQPPMIMLMATYPARRHLSLKVRLFTDFLIERFGDTAKWQ